MKANELTLGKRLFYNNGDTIKNVIITKLEDKGECINITVDCMVETYLGQRTENGVFAVEKDTDLLDEIVEARDYPLSGFISLNFAKLKENAISTMKAAKEDVIRRFDERIANLEKIQLQDL
jgi:hypothetical protein